MIKTLGDVGSWLHLQGRSSWPREEGWCYPLGWSRQLGWSSPGTGMCTRCPPATLLSTCSRFTTAGGLCSSQLLMVQNAGDSPDIHCRWLATAWAQFEEEMTNQSWLCMERWWQNTALPTWTNGNVLALGSQVPPGVKGLSILAIFCATHCMVAS